jgi:hypothetical protein
MNKAEYFQYLIPIVEPILSKQGFKYQKSKFGFLKKIKNGRLEINFSFYQFASTYNINASLDIRLDRIQDVFVKYRNINPNNFRDSYTIWFRLDRVNRHKSNAFSFQYPGELKKFIHDKVVPFLETDVPLFSERYVNLENLFNFFYREDCVEIFGVNPHDRFILALIIAKFRGEAEFNQVVKWSEEGLKNLRQEWPNSNEAWLFDKYFYDLLRDLRAPGK